MFKEMRRKEKQVTLEESIKIIRQGEYGVLSTLSSNGYPYGVPLSYVYTEEGIYFHCAKDGLKLENIENESKVSFCVIGRVELLPEQFSTRYESVVVFGTACEVFGEEKEKGLLALIDKYSQDFMEAGKQYIKNASDKTRVIKIQIDHITGKAGK